MDRAHDFDPFRALLDQLCAVFDRPPAKNELVQAYWDALRFAPIAEIERNVKRIVRTATKSTRWPKPGDLRDEAPEETAQKSSSAEAARRMAVDLNQRTWDELKTRDPELYALEIGIARCARILAADHESTPQHAEARRVDWQMRERRRQLLAERAAPVAVPPDHGARV
jgi:hypothetical protein